jgi:hypothetical protein
MKTFVSALDWGLGHATRIIPIIKELIDKGDEVIIGASNNQKTIYQEFFPELKIIRLPSASPVYSKGNNQVLSVFIFFPRFYFSIIREHIAIKSIVRKYGIEKIISDNRYGLYHRSVYSIFLGHQLNILLPRKIVFLQTFVNRLNCFAINQFNECWIPDNKPGKALTGELSVPRFKLSIPIIYRGVLSRFSIVEAEEVEHIPELLVLISGPERQRTVFEKCILKSLDEYKTPISYLIVRGIPAETKNSLPNSLNHCSAEQLKTLILKSKYIICRAGYSTVMDLVYLNRTAMLIPTPGQTEQEYIASLLLAEKMFLTTSQDKIDLKEVIQSLQLFLAN